MGIWVSLGDSARAAGLAQAIAGIRIAKKEFKETLKAAKEAAGRCRQQGDDVGEAQQLLTVTNVRLAQSQEQDSISMKRMMEALLAAKEALAIYRDLGDANGEAAALVAVAKVYRLKAEPLLAVEHAKEAAVICQTLGDMQGTANSLMLEATTYLMMFDAELTIPGQNGGSRVTLPRQEALCAATEALQIYQDIEDK